MRRALSLVCLAGLCCGLAADAGAAAKGRSDPLDDPNKRTGTTDSASNAKDSADSDRTSAVEPSWMQTLLANSFKNWAAPKYALLFISYVSDEKKQQTQAIASQKGCGKTDQTVTIVEQAGNPFYLQIPDTQIMQFGIAYYKQYSKVTDGTGSVDTYKIVTI